MIPVCEPTLKGNELKYATEAIQSGWISSAGPFITRFEQEFSKYCGVKHGIACSNGTTALHLALEACGIGEGDEVILPTFTMIASCNAILYARATPVLVDSELQTWNMDVSKIEEKITKKTKAIMVVHTYGHPVDMDKVNAIAKKHKLIVIEDAAEAHGAEYKGKKAGSLSDIACFSYYGNKILTCFPPDTKIIIEPPKGKRGLSRMKQISELKVGDSVLTYDVQTSVKEYKKVTRTFERDFNEHLLEIKFSNNNSLRMTPNHPVYVVNKGWVRADNLVVSDEVIQYNYRGLAFKEMYTGKKYEEIMGLKKANEKRKLHSLKIREIHSNPTSKYSQVDWRSLAVKMGHANRGKKHSEATREKMSNFQKLRWRTMSKEKYDEYVSKIRKMNSDPRVREKKREASLKLAENPEYIQKVSAGVRRAMEKDSYWVNYSRSMNLKPNKPEQLIISFLNTHFPNEFGYNGDYRLRVRVDRLIPDFVHINGKKKVIDILGNHWHTPDEHFSRTERYKKQGYDSLILWESELKDMGSLKDRIKTFLYNPNVKLVKIIQISKKEYSGKVYNIETEKNHNYFAHGILVHNCGEGGMVITNNDKWAERAKNLRNHFFGKKRFLHEEIGYNYRMTNVQAAIGCAQLERIEDLVNARRKNAQLYNSLLKNVKGITLPPEASWAKNVYWMYGILVQPEFGLTMPQLCEALMQKRVETRTFFIGMHKQPCYKKLHLSGSYKNSDELESKGMYLPSSSHLTKEQITFIVQSINEIQESNDNQK